MSGVAVVFNYFLFLAYLYFFSLSVVMDATLGQFFKPEKNLEFFRQKNWSIDGRPVSLSN